MKTDDLCRLLANALQNHANDMRDCEDPSASLLARITTEKALAAFNQWEKEQLAKAEAWERLLRAGPEPEDLMATKEKG